jgi:hypothetical protein
MRKDAAATGSRLTLCTAAAALLSALAAAVPTAALGQVQPYGTDSYGTFYNILPPGTNGLDKGSESPEPGVTIERDKQFGVPHIYGDTRAELMFGIGYATAEDRLFFIDALRHAGAGDLASFAGGSNVPMDESVWAATPYTQHDLVNQVNEGIAAAPLSRRRSRCRSVCTGFRGKAASPRSRCRKGREGTGP